MLAEVSSQLLARAGKDPDSWLRDRAGLYHLGGSGSISRYEWAQSIIKHDPHPGDQIVQNVKPALTEEFPTPAERPLYTALNCEHFEAIFGLHLPNWETALRLSMEVIS
jgi:dTDP-4-dehydrorhamnose reductase